MINPHKEKQDQFLARHEKQKEMEIPIELIKIQDIYNKRNGKRQHKFNLEIHKKQSRLAIVLSILTILGSFCSALAGVIVGTYLERNRPEQTVEIQLEKQALPSQDKAAVLGAQNHQKKDTKLLEQEAAPLINGKVSSSDVSSKSSYNKPLNSERQKAPPG
jgi:hypothetical protein